VRHRHRFNRIKLVLKVNGVEDYVWPVLQCECGDLKLEKELTAYYRDYMESLPHNVIHIPRFGERDSLTVRRIELKVYRCKCGFVGDSLQMGTHLGNTHGFNLRYAEKIGLVKPIGETVRRVKG